MAVLISDEVLSAAQLSDVEMLQEIAILLFQQERLTLAQASRLANLPRLSFQKLLASRQIPVHYDVAELDAEVAMMQESGYL
jgi:predicted HTH domain antitoxin